MTTNVISADHAILRFGFRTVVAAVLARVAHNRDMSHLAKLDQRLLSDVGLTSVNLDAWR